MTEIDQIPLDKSFFDRLADTAFGYLSEYYKQTERHANRAFAAALSMASLGGAVLIAGVAAAFFGLGDPSYVAVGAGVIGQFLSAVLFVLYARTVKNMKNYHNDLMQTLNLSIALRTADSLDENSDQAKTTVIESVNAVFRSSGTGKSRDEDPEP